MADFSSFIIQANVGNTATPNWQQISGGSGRELRWHNTSSVALNTAGASWPAVTRPASGTTGVDYAYAFTADTTGHGVYGGGASQPPAQFATSQYLQFRLNWDAVGTFASPPIITAYPTSAHGSVTRGDGTLLGGHASDTGATARSYLKGTLYGAGATTQTPAAGPGSSPTATSGATGAVQSSTGAWSSWQGLQGDNDYLQYPDTPTATTAQVLYFMLRLFMGANLSAGSHVPVLSCKYTFV